MGLNYTTAVPYAGKAQIKSHLSIHMQSYEVWKAVRCLCQTGKHEALTLIFHLYPVQDMT